MSLLVEERGTIVMVVDDREKGFESARAYFKTLWGEAAYFNLWLKLAVLKDGTYSYDTKKVTEATWTLHFEATRIETAREIT